MGIVRHQLCGYLGSFNQKLKITNMSISLEHPELFHQSGISGSFLYQLMKIN